MSTSVRWKDRNCQHKLYSTANVHSNDIYCSYRCPSTIHIPNKYPVRYDYLMSTHSLMENSTFLSWLLGSMSMERSISWWASSEGGVIPKALGVVRNSFWTSILTFKMESSCRRFHPVLMFYGKPGIMRDGISTNPIMYNSHPNSVHNCLCIT